MLRRQNIFLPLYHSLALFNFFSLRVTIPLVTYLYVSLSKEEMLLLNSRARAELCVYCPFHMVSRWDKILSCYMCHWYSSGIYSEAIPCSIVLEDDPALSEPHKSFPYIGLIFLSKKWRITLPPMLWFPPALCRWGSPLLNELTEVQFWCGITAVAQRWLSPTPTKDHPTDSLTWRWAPRDEEEHPPGGEIRMMVTGISVCLMSALVWGIKKYL